MHSSSQRLESETGMVASHSFGEMLREQLAPLGDVTLRRMFGKTGVFCDGLMLGMVRDDVLYFRVDDDNRDDLQGGRSLSAAQLREGRRQHRPRVLARAGTAVRRAGRICRLGARGPGRGTAGGGETGARSTAEDGKIPPDVNDDSDIDLVPAHDGLTAG